MNKTIFPLKLRMRRNAVGDLQDGLQFLLDAGYFELSDADRQTLEERLRGERARTTYGQTTRKLVVLFQQQRQLEASGEVDEPTANALVCLAGAGWVKLRNGLPHEEARIWLSPNGSISVPVQRELEVYNPARDPLSLVSVPAD